MKKIFAVTIILAALFVCGCGDGEKHFERSEKIMGTVVTLKADGKNSEKAVNESFEKIFAFVENIKSDVTKLNETAGSGEYVKLNPDVFEVLQISQKYSELTGGAFDVTVGAAVDLWKVARKNKILPDAGEIDDTKNFVGYKHLYLNESEQSAMIDKAGVKINLGGVGKGYGADIARKIFVANGITDGIIDFGTSSIFVFGKKKIGLKNPRGENEISEVVEVENSALSTSGDYEQFFIVEGRRFHHIINPETCMPSDKNISSVSLIVAGDFENCGTVADILSTSIFVLGEEHGKNLVKKIGREKINIVALEKSDE